MHSDVKVSPPQLVHFVSIRIQLADPIDLGDTSEGHRRIVPIVGGEVNGDGITGVVLAAGEDNQILESETVTRLDATYILELSDGARIYVKNLGVRSAEAATMKSLLAGEDVDPSLVYFRTAPRLVSSSPNWNWLSSTFFLATGRREPAAVNLEVFKVA